MTFQGHPRSMKRLPVHLCANVAPWHRVKAT